MDQFLSLKKERKQLERLLDDYEDELEKQYRNGSLSRDEYKDKDREPDSLDDRSYPLIQISAYHTFICKLTNRLCIFVSFCRLNDNFNITIVEKYFSILGLF